MVQKVLVIDPTTSFDAELTPNTTSAGAADAGKLVALNASGVLDTTLMPPGLGVTSKVLPATEALAAGAMVNVYNASGTTSIRNANATDATKPAHGIVLSAVSSSANGTVYFGTALVTGLSGLTVGAPAYLGTTAGTITPTAPSATGNLMQQVGIVADSTTEMVMAIERGTIRG